MTDRKYRQRGYQDDSRDRERERDRPATPPRGPRERPEGPRTPNLMAFHTVSRCTRCGNLLTAAIEADSRCTRCGVDLHSCIQCVSFDPGSPLECRERIPARVSPKDVRNTCTLFAARESVERETGSSAPTSARQAFDDLFKF